MNTIAILLQNQLIKRGSTVLLNVVLQSPIRDVLMLIFIHLLKKTLTIVHSIISANVIFVKEC